jgi:fructose-1,6-bisphosphatase/inositol monophosphatase family enzyme
MKVWISHDISLDLISPMQAMAREAGSLLMDYFRQHVKIEYKGDVDLVTVADRESEALILERIRSSFRARCDGRRGTRIETGSEYKWYVDPLDGTTNFAHGYPVFCVSLAVERRGQRVAGVIYDPTRDEMFSAELGSGARLNDQRSTSRPRESGRMPDRHRLSQPQAAQESEYLFLSPAHAAHARREAGGVGGARSVQCRVGPV